MQASRNSAILVGEDEAEVRNYLEMALRCHGYVVETVEDGEEVMGCLHSGEREFSAVLLDIFMPNKDGIETLREIRTFNRKLPVIMISEEATPSRVTEAMRIGASDFLGKPVSHEDPPPVCQQFP